LHIEPWQGTSLVPFSEYSPECVEGERRFDQGSVEVFLERGDLSPLSWSFFAIQRDVSSGFRWGLAHFPMKPGPIADPTPT
jgi:hypothetical protein